MLQEAIDAGSFVDEAGAGRRAPTASSGRRRLARQEGIFTGISGGATFAAAVKVAEQAPAGSVLLAMLPDTGERYLSTPLFEGIETEMDDEERALMQSTPGYQMTQ
ncbi:MAG: hypothetical protein U5K43_07380 [Halofilum sp. (in: g-proteobacteria)]|nr:hypothetical protein [Halofilum sp. (in: g-proteobacteria)]